jgi:hypothetical protein
VSYRLRIVWRWSPIRLGPAPVCLCWRLNE